MGEIQKAEEILDQLANNSVEYASWYLSLDDDRFTGSYEECMRHFYILDDVCKALATLDGKQTDELSETAAHYAKKFDQLYQLLEQRIGAPKGEVNN